MTSTTKWTMKYLELKKNLGTTGTMVAPKYQGVRKCSSGKIRIHPTIFPSNGKEIE